MTPTDLNAATDRGRAERWDVVQKLVAARHSSGIAATEVASSLAIGLDAVTDFESGQTDASVNEIRQYAVAIGVVVRFDLADE